MSPASSCWGRDAPRAALLRAASKPRLRETATKLRAAGAAKDEFLATLAHELRNPLAPMRNAVELMELAPDNAEVLATARGMMARQIAHMVRLVDDLLDVSRASRGFVEAGVSSPARDHHDRGRGDEPSLHR